MNQKEKAILKFANELMKPLGKYGNKTSGYNFSKAKTARLKAEVIQIWIGEIIHEVIKYKDPEGLKSLTEMIVVEIEELIRPARRVTYHRVATGSKRRDHRSGV